MSDRPIFFDARDRSGRLLADLGPDDSARSGGLPSGAPSDQDQSRFRDALNGRAPAGGPVSPSSETSAPMAVRLASPFELLGASPSPTREVITDPAARLDPLCSTIDRFVRRMTLADGRDGRRGLNVDLDLEGEAVPGVTLSVLHDAGAWLAEFRCRQPQSYRLLARPAVEMAARLAQALDSDAVWRVIAEEGVAAADWADLAGVCDERGTIEAFCSAPSGGRR